MTSTSRVIAPIEQLVRVGDRREAKDDEDTWNECTVTKILGSEARVTYDGWPHEHDAEIPVEQLYPVGSFTLRRRCWLIVDHFGKQDPKRIPIIVHLRAASSEKGVYVFSSQAYS